MQETIISLSTVFSSPTRSTGGLSTSTRKWLAASCAAVLFALPSSGQSRSEVGKRVSQAVVKLESFDSEGQPKGLGSGFLVNSNGLIVTNYHVVERAFEDRGVHIRVTLDNHQTLEAALTGGDPNQDLAVVWIDPAKARIKLRPINLADASKLLVGQRVYAIGNPFGLDQTMTMGIISALGRQIKSVTGVPIRGMIQTTATLNPGNSGGPLLDSATKRFQFVKTSPHLRLYHSYQFRGTRVIHPKLRTLFCLERTGEGFEILQEVP